MRRYWVLAIFFVLLWWGLAASGQAPPQAVTDTISLPAPSRAGGMALSEALAKRRSIRTLASTPLTQQEISQLLWAAQGITDDKGHRTAPSARAAYYLRTYLATPDGFFEYLSAGHQLKKLSGADLRAKLSTQATVTAAPFVLLLAGENERALKAGADTGIRYVYVEAGHAAQNVLLQATALGLGAVPVGGFQPAQAAQAAGLPDGIVPLYLIPVGHQK